MTGVECYLLEILAHAGPNVTQISSAPIAGGIKGHLWEQFILPTKTRKALLWSPSNSGPLLVKNQVVTIHDAAVLDHPEWLSKQYALWCNFMLPRLVLRARRIITVSEFTKQRLLATTKAPPEKIYVIHNGVHQRFRPHPRHQIESALAPLNLPSHHYILSVGSLEPRKNLKRLLAAWRIAQSSLPNNLWLILAGGKGNAAVFGESSLNDIPPRVHMTGHVDDQILPALYAGAAAFAYISEYEGFGLPPLTAMASGVPVIVSNTTVFPEVVGSAGLYVDPRDIQSAAAGLTRLLTDQTLAADLAAQGLERAKLFSWKRTADLTMQLLLDTANA